jgi:F5/8 type C domain/PEP-CTERM motif
MKGDTLMMFRKILLPLLLVSILPLFANAAPITFTDVTGLGTYANSLDLLTDGTFPAEWSPWDSTSTVSFNQWGSGYDREFFIFDMGSLFTINDIAISVDNNDSYTIEYSTDQSNWLNLTTVDLHFGNVTNGMDTMTTISGNFGYVGGLDFTQSVLAQYLRIYVDGWQGSTGTSSPDVGDGAYALGEFQAFGEAYVAPPTGPAPVPEPSTFLLLGGGIAGLAFYRRRTKK